MPAHRTRSRVVAAIVIGLAALGALVGLWQLAAQAGWLSELAPTPARTARRAVELLSDPLYRDGPAAQGIFWHLLASLRRVLLGFLIATVIAVPIGYMLGRSTTLRWAVDPAIQVLRPVSPLAWLPLGLALFVDAERTAVFVIVISALWPTMIATIDSVRSVEPVYLDLAATLGTGPWRRATRVIIPAALPGIVTGLRLSLSTSWLVIIAAEMLVGGQGIGFFVWNMWNQLDIDAIVVSIVLIGLVGLILDNLILQIRKAVAHD